MSVPATDVLVGELIARGLTMWLEKKVFCCQPRGLLTESDLENLRAARDEVLLSLPTQQPEMSEEKISPHDRALLQDAPFEVDFDDLSPYRRDLAVGLLVDYQYAGLQPEIARRLAFIVARDCEEN